MLGARDGLVRRTHALNGQQLFSAGSPVRLDVRVSAASLKVKSFLRFNEVSAMPANPCAYCGLRPAEGQGACAVCRPHVGTIVFGSQRDNDGLLFPKTAFHYGEPVMADIYFSEDPRVENLELLGRHSNPRPDHSGSIRLEEYIRIEAPSRRLMKRYFSASAPTTDGLFRDRTHFVAGVDYDVLAQHGPGRITITYRRSIVWRVLAEGAFDLLD